VNGRAEANDDEAVVAAAVMWTALTAIVLLFNALFFEIMQGIATFSLFVIPTAILWAQVISRMLRGRVKVKCP